MAPLSSRQIVGMRVDATSYSDAVSRVLDWASRRESRYVCVSTVHNAMCTRDSDLVRSAINGADLVTPDGMPLVWALKLLGVPHASRVYGPDLTPLVLAAAARDGIPVAFYGGADDARLRRLLAMLSLRFPGLKISYAWAPPFRPLTAEEDQRVTAKINQSGARILFIGLSSPKQDIWMAAHRGRVDAVMLGVGAAFDFLAGIKPQAPRWMMRSGLEWLFRLATEPRRLWKRYLRDNPRFVLLFGRQCLVWRLFGRAPATGL